MAGISAGLRARNKQRFITVLAMVGVMGAVLVVALFLLNRTEKVLPTRFVQFDPTQCARVHDVSRVYRIRSNPQVTDEIWFATAEGIRVLDTTRLEWTRYGLDHGLLSETVSDICFAGDRIWAATWAGLALFDRSNKRFVPLQFSAGMGGTRILAAEYSSGEGVYFSVDERGLFVLRDGAEIPQQVAVGNLRASARITCLQAKGDRLWVGAEGRRLFVKISGDTTFTEVAFGAKEAPKTFIWDITHVGDTVYVGTSNEGVYKGVGTGPLVSMQHFPAKGAYAFAAESDGFWCGTPFGLWRYHQPADAWVQFVHPEQDDAVDFQVFALENDASRVWYGSMDLGAGFMTKTRVEWHNLRSGLGNPNIAALGQVDSLLYVGFGYQGGYADLFDSRTLQFLKTIRSEQGVRDAQVQRVFADSARAWLGTFTGCAVVGGNGSVVWHAPGDQMPYGDIVDMLRLDTTHLLLAGAFGVVQYDSRKGTFAEMPGTALGRVSALTSAADTVWFGTLNRGVWRKAAKDSIAVRLALQTTTQIMGLGTAVVNGRRFVAGATKADGLFVMGPDGSGLNKPAVPAGLLEKGWDHYGNQVMAAAVSGSLIIVGLREKGCLLYDFERNLWGRFDYYNGLVSDQVRSISVDTAHVWIGCFGGFNRIKWSYFEQTAFAQ